MNDLELNFSAASESEQNLPQSSSVAEPFLKSAISNPKYPARHSSPELLPQIRLHVVASHGNGWKKGVLQS